MLWKPQDTFLKLLSRKEKVLFFISSLLVLVAALSLFLFRENDQGNQSSLQLQKIGSIEFTGLDVKRKSLGEADFKDSSNKDSLFQKDTLYVGPGSRAKIILPEYGNFELEPNAVVLVVLDFEKLNVDKNTSTNANSKTRGLKLRLIQGKLKFEAKKTVAGDESSTPSPENQTQIRIEIADNTVLELGDQKELNIEKKKEGDFRVLNSSTNLRAVVSSADSSQSPKEIIVPPNRDLSSLALTKNTQELNRDLTSQGLKNEIIANMAHVASLSDHGRAVPETRNESFFRWGAKSGQATEHSEEIKKILSEYSATKAGNVELGEDESGGKYFHFYTPKQNLKEIEERLQALLGDSFYKELVSSHDPKSRHGNTRVVFVLFADGDAKTKHRVPAQETVKEMGTTPEIRTEKLLVPMPSPSVDMETKFEPVVSEVAVNNPVPANPPSAVNAVTANNGSSEHYRSWSEYEFSAKTFYCSLHAIDKSSRASADFYSKQNFGGGAAWTQRWTSRFSSKIAFNVIQESWDQNLTKGRVLTNKSYTTTGILLGTGFHPSDSLEITSFISLAQQSVRRSINSGTEIVFETPQVTIVDVGAKKQFHLTSDYHLGLSIDFFSTLPKSLPNYNIKFSPGVKVGASLREYYSTSFLEAQIFWDYLKQNSSILEETRSSLGLSITFGFGSNPNKKALKNKRAQ